MFIISFIIIFPHLINDLPFYVLSSQIDLYADDINVTSSADYEDTAKLNDFQKTSVSEVTEWATAKKLTLNMYKTKTLIVSGKRLRSKMGRNMLCNSSNSYNYVKNVKAWN